MRSQTARRANSCTLAPSYFLCVTSSVTSNNDTQCPERLTRRPWLEVTTFASKKKAGWFWRGPIGPDMHGS
ncbi:uncharacterized protein LAESUDRAFT_720688 [Laetiporus sulphureus 93-53]|uniref:Uncharacterized protein n=1 Tax=Laetiporus sulphureus 93-53 TaxID=1314785 RepID=A0A165HA42_9APHY|nr:uncharacterized protein LAESUDRAFT_720688 [Laetiporus sulphureus 93-53]KZT11454.1 hypothetical protein LAESUDRAFT_720688 [Laetiporus sulphureus 93-53]